MKECKVRTTAILVITLRRLRPSEIHTFLERKLFFSEAMLREAFRVTFAVTKVDSLLRAKSDSESFSALKSNLGDEKT